MQQLAAALYARATQEADSGEAKRPVVDKFLARNSFGFLLLLTLGLCVPLCLFEICGYEQCSLNRQSTRYARSSSVHLQTS